MDCKLLQGATAITAQLLLGLLAVCALVYKRYHEVPQRPFNVWLLDVTKQIISTGAAHICGMLIAMIASAHASSSASQCSWYFVAFTFDTTLGVAITIGIHKAVLWLARNASSAHPKAKFLAALVDCGYYGNPIRLWRWGLQLAEWTAAVIAARAVVGVFVIAANGLLVWVAELLDKMFAGHPDALLFSVMIACPLGMNTAQLLIQDAVLKWKRALRGPVASRASADGVWDDGWDTDGSLDSEAGTGERTGLLQLNRTLGGSSSSRPGGMGGAGAGERVVSSGGSLGGIGGVDSGAGYMPAPSPGSRKSVGVR